MSDKQIISGAFPRYEFDSVAERFIAKGGMSLQEYAAIKLKVPDSGVDWLDAMIERSRRDDLAAMAMQGAAASEVTYTGFKQAAHDSYEMADAMLSMRMKNA